MKARRKDKGGREEGREGAGREGSPGGRLNYCSKIGNNELAIERNSGEEPLPDTEKSRTEFAGISCAQANENMVVPK